MDLLQFYCNGNCDMGSHKKNTRWVPYVDMSVHYTCYLSCKRAWWWIDL